MILISFLFLKVKYSNSLHKKTSLQNLQRGLVLFECNSISELLFSLQNPDAKLYIVLQNL